MRCCAIASPRTSRSPNSPRRSRSFPRCWRRQAARSPPATTVRAATLVATGQPGTLQIRLADPATKGERAGLGACTGDSGAPVYRDVGGALAVIGVVSWSTGPALSEGCGGLTGVTPLTRYRAWLVEQAGK